MVKRRAFDSAWQSQVNYPTRQLGNLMAGIPLPLSLVFTLLLIIVIQLNIIKTYFNPRIRSSISPHIADF